MVSFCARVAAIAGLNFDRNHNLNLWSRSRLKGRLRLYCLPELISEKPLTPSRSPGERLHELPTLANRPPEPERGCALGQPQQVLRALRLVCDTAALRAGFIATVLRLSLLLILACAEPILGADTNAILNNWLSAQKGLQTWQADFVQTRMLKTLTQPLVATGHIWFATPNRFRWELRWPSQTIALRDAEQMWVIYPRLKRAERYPLDAKSSGEWRDMLSLLEAGFPRDRADFESRFRILSLTETNRSWQLTFQPASAFARKMMKEIEIGLAMNEFALTSTELVFIDGSRMRNDFTNGVLNSGFDMSVFDWKPPADFKVTEPLGK